MVTESFIEQFTAGYIEALLWSSVVLIDGDYVAADTLELSTAGADKCRADCRAFCNAYSHLLDEVTGDIDDYDASHAGHDFALTRNRHGSGYWDHDLMPKAVSDLLTEAAQSYGETDLYEHDGEIEIS